MNAKSSLANKKKKKGFISFPKACASYLRKSKIKKINEAKKQTIFFDS